MNSYVCKDVHSLLLMLTNLMFQEHKMIKFIHPYEMYIGPSWRLDMSPLRKVYLTTKWASIAPMNTNP